MQKILHGEVPSASLHVASTRDRSNVAKRKPLASKNMEFRGRMENGLVLGLVFSGLRFFNPGVSIGALSCTKYILERFFPI